MCVLSIALSLAACTRQAPPATVAAQHCEPLPGTVPSAPPPVNDTPLSVEPLTSPISKMSVRFLAPELDEAIAIGDPRAYQVRLLADLPEADALGIDVALDDERPRRVVPAQAVITLGQLTRVEAELALGEHWLFAAPVLASGLVPRVAAGSRRAAVARRFFIGKSAHDSAGPSGAVWLRKPEGTYNGAAAEHVVFDAFSFDAAGVALEAPCTITLSAPGGAGDMRLPAPFSVRALHSGDYGVTVSAPAARSSALRFTVNRELGDSP
jgi:hypothetical protein